MNNTFARACGSAVLLAVVIAVMTTTTSAQNVQVKAVARNAPTPPWDKGILPISAESYWNAVECGKQGTNDPPCVFWDTGICKNADFALAFYTPYKSVAYEVWRVVRQKQPPPTPSFQEAQQTRITIGVTPVPGAKNVLTDLKLTRGGKVAATVDRSLDAGGGRFTFDYPVFAATAPIKIDLIGKSRTISCEITQAVLTTFR